MSIGLSQAVVPAGVLKIQRAKAIEALVKGDKDIVEFFRHHPHLLDLEGMADLVERAEEAFDRLNAGGVKIAVIQQEVEQPNQQDAETDDDAEEAETEDEKKKRRNRERLAYVFYKWKCLEAAKAVREFDLSADGKTLAETAKAIRDAIDEVGNDTLKDERVEKIAWALFYGAQNRAREIAREKADKFIFDFVRNLQDLKWALQSGDFRRARRIFDWLSKTYFPGYILGAMEKMIDIPGNTISNLIRDDAEVATSLANVSEGQRAKAITEALKSLLAKLGVKLSELEKEVQLTPTYFAPKKKTMRRGKTKRDHEAEAAREEPKPDRSEKDREYRNSMKGQNPSAESFKKGKKSKK